jgi:hypothetical protein
VFELAGVKADVAAEPDVGDAVAAGLLEEPGVRDREQLRGLLGVDERLDHAGV